MDFSGLWKSISRKINIYNHIFRDYADKSGPDVTIGDISLKMFKNFYMFIAVQLFKFSVFIESV